MNSQMFGIPHQKSPISVQIFKPIQWKNQTVYILQHGIEEFVASHIVPHLEKNYGASVYFPPRNDTPGKDVFSNARDAVLRSDMVFLFLTNELLEHPMFGYTIEMSIIKGFQSVIIAIEKDDDLSIATFPGHIKWLLKLCRGTVCFSRSEPLELDGITNCIETNYGKHFLQEPEAEDAIPDICVIHPDDGTTTVQDVVTNYEELHQVNVFCSERDVTPGKYITAHLLEQMYRSHKTVFILNNDKERSQMKFLLNVAARRTEVPCAVIYDPCVFQDIEAIFQSESHVTMSIKQPLEFARLIPTYLENLL